MTDRERAPRVPVTIVIKALNEERRICDAIESSLAALADIGGEVILADSCSSDRTVELASRYPIRIVQLANASERCCGIGPQLGFQHARGEYIYILDGDMRIAPGFLEEALPFLAQHPEVAGVGGRVIEANTDSIEFRERALRGSAHMQAGEVDRLDCGGLYRRLAIEDVGFFSNRNLHSYEEFDLGVRLRANGWRLWRLPLDGVIHHGHDMDAYTLLARRWRSKYACGPGEIVRAALRHKHLWMVLREVRELRVYAGTVVWWGVLAASALWPAPVLQRAAVFTGVLATPFIVMALRKRSITRAVYSVTSWCVHAAGLLRGLFRAQTNPTAQVQSRVLHEPLNAPVTSAAQT